MNHTRTFFLRGWQNSCAIQVGQEFTCGHGEIKPRPRQISYGSGLRCGTVGHAELGAEMLRQKSYCGFIAPQVRLCQVFHGADQHSLSFDVRVAFARLAEDARPGYAFSRYHRDVEHLGQWTKPESFGGAPPWLNLHGEADSAGDRVFPDSIGKAAICKQELRLVRPYHLRAPRGLQLEHAFRGLLVDFDVGVVGDAVIPAGLEKLLFQ